MDKLAKLVALVAHHTPNEGANPTALPGLMLHRESEAHRALPTVFEPHIVLAVQGKKQIELNSVVYAYHAGAFLTTLVTVVADCRVIDATPDAPMLVMALPLDAQRVRTILMKMEQAGMDTFTPTERDPSGLFTAPINDGLLDAAIRLMQSLDDPAEAAVLGEAAIDEIYFRILKHERGGNLPLLLQQRGQIQQIAKAVDYLHQNLSQVVPIEDLAALVNMSSSAFHKKFKEVMHLPPLQYAKQIKLNKAQTRILSGMTVSEAGYLAGYNSPAQFSREYKRYFGIAPSAERSGGTKPLHN